MATAPEISHDDVRDLIAKGWTPPAEVLERYRHLLRPFYDAMGWTALPAAKLDSNDCKSIAALIAVFDHFGIAMPGESEQRVEEAPWVTVLRAYVAEHDGFTTDEAVIAVGFDPQLEISARSVAATLREWGLSSATMQQSRSLAIVTRWTKRCVGAA